MALIAGTESDFYVLIHDRLDEGIVAVTGAALLFLLPVSTPQNAIAYGSGVVPITLMIRTGASFDVTGGILILLLIPLMAGLLGFG